jgi:sec-independent protein translocase protein TatB|tara:strand:+ start:272 stop:499 length:228 start_codon:yes stop_codon:yes gene_type:complete
MPQIGWFEILIIVAIAIIVIGPKDFPFVLKKIGSWIGSVKRYVSNIQQEVSDLTDDNFEIKSKESKTEKKDNVKK